MDSATAWSVRGVGRETRVFAEEAARRAGLSLGDWLDEVIAERAAERGVEPADLQRDDRLDAIGERIARLTQRDDPPRPRPQVEPRWPREAPAASEARRGDDLLEAAIARLESRAERAEALQAAAERLAAVEQRVERTLEPRARNLDARLDALARRVESEPNGGASRLRRERPNGRVRSARGRGADRPPAQRTRGPRRPAAGPRRGAAAAPRRAGRKRSAARGGFALGAG